MPNRSSSNTHLLSKKHVTAFSHLGTLRSTSALCVGAILNSETTNTKYKNIKNVALSRPRKEHMFTVWAEMKAEHHLVGLLALDESILPPLYTCLRITAKAPRVLIWGLQINVSKSVNSQIRNLQVMKTNCNIRQADRGLLLNGKACSCPQSDALPLKGF